GNRIFHRLWKVTEAIPPFSNQGVQLFFGRDFGDSSISLNPQRGFVNVATGEKSGDAEVVVNKLGLVCGNKIEAQLHFKAPLGSLSLNLGDGLLEQLTIQVETDGNDVATLSGTENTASTTNLEISHCDTKTGTE